MQYLALPKAAGEAAVRALLSAGPGLECRVQALVLFVS
jgi:hypothetical protein